MIVAESPIVIMAAPQTPTTVAATKEIQTEIDLKCNSCKYKYIYYKNIPLFITYLYAQYIYICIYYIDIYIYICIFIIKYILKK